MRTIRSSATLLAASALAVAGSLALAAPASAAPCGWQGDGTQDYKGSWGKGGYVFKGPWGSAVTSNITSHPAAGLGAWTDAEIRRVMGEFLAKAVDQIEAERKTP